MVKYIVKGNDTLDYEGTKKFNEDIMLGKFHISDMAPLNIKKMV